MEGGRGGVTGFWIRSARYDQDLVFSGQDPSSPAGARKILTFGHHFVKGKQCFRGFGRHFFVCDAYISIRAFTWSRLDIRKTQVVIFGALYISCYCTRTIGHSQNTDTSRFPPFPAVTITVTSEHFRYTWICKVWKPSFDPLKYNTPNGIACSR